ncbi:hypothetical protein N7490_012174 [Penicillium lividum]|nr:hypothetical protein N7490_012174 [Penicillium lividum]
MAIRERVKAIFHRSSKSTSQLNGKPKVEYYRRNEVPPSKFKGPADKAVLRQFSGFSFDSAMSERRRSLDMTMSPFDTTGISPFDSDGTEDISPDADGVPIMSSSDAEQSSVSPISTDLPRAFHGSESSTVVNSNSDSYNGSNGSLLTLLPEISVYEIPEDPIAQFKDSIRYTSPIVRAMSPAPKSPRGKQLPFAPEELTRALAAVQLCA